MKKTIKASRKVRKNPFFEKHNNRARTRGRVIQEVKMENGSRFIYHRYFNSNLSSNSTK
jgi:hypothetical protein